MNEGWFCRDKITAESADIGSRLAGKTGMNAIIDSIVAVDEYNASQQLSIMRFAHLGQHVDLQPQRDSISILRSNLYVAKCEL